MKPESVSTRRRFFWKAGAALSAPLAVAPAGASADNAEDSEGLQARLATLEDENAIRELNRVYARHVNARERGEIAKLFADPARAPIDDTVRNLSSDHLGQQDVIEVASDHQSATARIHCTAQIETAIGPSCPLVEMAREQGGGVVRRSENGVLENAYVKQGEVWKIARSTYRPV